jgi:peptide/nickel transport system permease protein
LVSLVGLQAGSLIGGALFAEQVFSRPGVGTALTEAIAGRDYPVIQVIVLTTGFLFATITLVVDLLMHALDLRLSAA